MIKSARAKTSQNPLISESPSTRNPLRHQRQKSIVTVSKSSSEGASTLDGVDTSITSMEESKTSSPINKLSSNVNSRVNNFTSVPSSVPASATTSNIPILSQIQDDSAVTTSITTETPDTETLMLATSSNQTPVEKIGLISTSASMNTDSLSQKPLHSSAKRLPKDEDSFKVSIQPPADSMIHIVEDLSTRTSSSDELSIDEDNLANTTAFAYQTHSYRVLARPTSKTEGTSQNQSNADIESRRQSGVDPLVVLDDEHDRLIPLPHSEPQDAAVTPSNYLHGFKNNTYPRSSIENAAKNRNNKDLRSSLPTANSSNTIKTHVDRRPYQSINTIKIPDNYQRTKLAKSSGAEIYEGSNHGDIAKRHRVAKTSSFINNPRKKSRMKADNLYNIPGQNISEKHQNYAVVYDLVTGIRFSVSRCSKNPVQITDEQFKQVTKLIFSRQGNTQAPPTKYEFKFKDYAPEVFRDLRRMFNVNQADYLMSLNDEIGVRAVGSSGKSGSSFYYSNDRKFIIKTIHRSEHKHLRRILKDYYNYVKQNPNTLLCQFYGLHRLKMATRTGTVKVHVLVMNNLLPPLVNTSDCYDLKGSTYGRKTSEKKKLQGSCLKDLNFIENKTEIYLSNEKKMQIEFQLKRDVDLLKSLNIMDYSLLLGLKFLNRVDENLLDENSKRFSQITHQNVPGAHKNSIFDTDGGIRAIDTHGNEMDVVYYIGIIDCLTNYSTLKKLETFFRSLRHKRETISAVPPYEYGDRFLNFIFDHIKSPGDEVIEKKKGFSKFKAFKKFTNHHTA